MKKNKQIFLIVFTVLALFGISTFAVIHYKKTDINGKGISGAVISVINRPNQAEDGYYGIDVQTDSGQKYTINATGYLNTPEAPDQFGEACVDVPKVKVGDKVSFNLPRSESQANTFSVCYKKNLSGYYFKLR